VNKIGFINQFQLSIKVIISNNCGEDSNKSVKLAASLQNLLGDLIVMSKRITA
jgi:hypothetical protein